MITAIDKKSISYITSTNLEKRISHIRTSILLKLGGPLQLVNVLILCSSSYLFVIVIQHFSLTSRDVETPDKPHLPPCCDVMS